MSDKIKKQQKKNRKEKSIKYTKISNRYLNETRSSPITMTKASLQSARNRLAAFPKLTAACSKEALVYGQCVTRKHDDIVQNSCQKEFQQFRACLQNAAQKMKIRI